MELVPLHGISFADLPHISKDEEVVVIRESGELWDSEARPAYSVRLNGLHIGYIPLVETIKEEALMAETGFKKVWKEPYDSMTKEELRRISAELNKEGVLLQVRDYTFVGKEEMASTARRTMELAGFIEYVRDWLYTEVMRNHATPHGRIVPIYFDEKEGKNFDEIGEVCSLKVRLPIEGVDRGGWISATEASQMTQDAFDKEQ